MLWNHSSSKQATVFLCILQNLYFAFLFQIKSYVAPENCFLFRKPQKRTLTKKFFWKMLICEKLVFSLWWGLFLPTGISHKAPSILFYNLPHLCPIYSQAERSNAALHLKGSQGEEKEKNPYHDLNNAVVGVVCHSALHLPVAHHTPEVTLALLILAYCTPPRLVFSAVGVQLICKSSRGKTRITLQPYWTMRLWTGYFLSAWDSAMKPSVHTKLLLPSARHLISPGPAWIEGVILKLKDAQKSTYRPERRISA